MIFRLRYYLAFLSTIFTSGVLCGGEYRATPLFKIIILGDSGVGKSNLLSAFVDDTFSDETLTTIGVDFQTKELSLDGRRTRAQIWDTAGQERFHAMSRSIYTGSRGVVLVFDITNESSFTAMGFWLNEVKKHIFPAPVMLLVGNKLDLEHHRQVKKSAAQHFAEENGLSYIETSARERTQVQKAFMWLLRAIDAQKELAPAAPAALAAPAATPPKQRVHLVPSREQPQPKKTSCKC